MSRRTGNNYSGPRWSHSHSQKKRPRLWRYEVDAVWGFEDRTDPPVSVGDLLIDHWKGDRTWNVHKLPPAGNMENVGGWHAKLIGEYDGPTDSNGQPVSATSEPS